MIIYEDGYRLFSWHDGILGDYGRITDDNKDELVNFLKELLKKLEDK